VRRLSPAWFLFLFAPLTAEYVSGSSPYLNPFVYLANLLLYGAGAILIRELRVRWDKGWLAVFILATAYMVAEEGLMLNTLFDPLRNTSGRWMGVNWVWTAGMFVIHTLVGIFVPILTAEAIYSERARESWITPRAFWSLLVAFAANVFGLGRLIAPYNRPGITAYLVELAFIGGCLWLSRIVPEPRPVPTGAIRPRSFLSLFLRALIGMAITMVIGFAAPTIAIPPLAQATIILATYAAFLELLRRSGTFQTGLDPLSKFTLAAGIVSFWVLVSPLSSFAKGNIGPVSFGLFMAAFLLNTLKRLRKRIPIPNSGEAV
jgi:hypothetical protein